MNRGGILKFKIVRRIVSLGRELLNERFSSTIKERVHPIDFPLILLVRAAFEAGGQAHLHFRIDAPRELRIGIQVLYTAAHLKKIEGVISKFLGCDSGREWAIVVGNTLQAAKAASNGRT